MAKKKKLSPTSDQPAKSDLSDAFDPPIDFETSLGEIEQIVRDLEGGNLTLDESLKQYEHAVGKMRQCYGLLEVAERKISVLAGFDAEGNPVTKPMNEPEVDASVETEALLHKQKSRGRRRGAAGSDLPRSGDDSQTNESFQ